MKRFVLVLTLTLATALLLFAAVEEGRRAETRRFLDGIRASSSVPRKETRLLRMTHDNQPMEMQFTITRDAAGRSRSGRPSGMKIDGRDPWESRKDKGFGPPPVRDYDRPEWRRPDGDERSHDWKRPEGEGRPEWKRPDGEIQGQRPPRPSRPIPGDFELDPDHAANNYLLTQKPGAVILGRETVEGTLTPKTADRPTLRLSVDKEKRFVLRLEVCPVSGQWAVLFDTIALDLATPIEPMNPPVAAERADARIIPRDLPGGFTHVSTTSFDHFGSKGQESKYSDGVATLRVIVSDRQPWWRRETERKPENTSAVPVARHRMGAFSEYGLQVDGLYVTVMGSLADDAMARVIGSLTVNRRP